VIKKNINKENINQVKNLIENNQISISVKLPNPNDEYGYICSCVDLIGSWRYQEGYLQYEVWDTSQNWEICWIDTSSNEIEIEVVGDDLKWEEIKKFFPVEYKIIKEIKSLLDI